MEPSLRSAIFGYSVKEYFHNPEVYLENYLKHEIYHFTEIQDDVPILLHVPVYRSAYFEAILCGAEIVYLDDHDAVLPDTPHLKDLSDVGALPIADFNQGEVMSYAKKLYEYVCEQVRGREFTVSFMEWLRNPFGVATWLYGEEKLLTAMASDPEGVHRLISYATQSRKKWTRQRAKYLGEEDYVTAGMYSDSVRGTLISPQQYLEFVQPYEMGIAELHGGIYYWHCCGDTTKLLEQLGGLPLELSHVGPWTCFRLHPRISKARYGRLFVKQPREGQPRFLSKQDLCTERTALSRMSKRLSDGFTPPELYWLSWCYPEAPVPGSDHTPAFELLILDSRYFI